MRRALPVRCNRGDPAPLTCIEIISTYLLVSATKYQLLFPIFLRTNFIAQTGTERAQISLNFCLASSYSTWLAILAQIALHLPNQPSLFCRSAVTFKTAVTAATLLDIQNYICPIIFPPIKLFADERIHILLWHNYVLYILTDTRRINYSMD